jgi:hypothetical protein
MSKDITLIKEAFKEMLIDNPLTEPWKPYNLSSLFGRDDLSQGQKIQLGIRIEYWINMILNDHPNVNSIKGKDKNLWMNTDTNQISSVAPNGLKDIDHLFIFNNKTYYLECKTNLGLDTEKGPATVKKVNTIVKCLTDNGSFPEVTGKIISPFWDIENVYVAPSMENSIMFFGEFSKLLGLDLTKDTYHAACKELGELL